MKDTTLPSSQAAAGCGCNATPRTNERLVKWTTAGGVLAALGVCAACYLLPVMLVSVGIAGAWVSTLDALVPYKWIFILATVLFLGYGFYAAYWSPRSTCSAGAACKACGSSRSIRASLWIAVVLAAGGIAFEYIEPYP